MRRAVILGLLVIATVGQVAPVAAQSGTISADLVVRQPDYIDSDVERFDVNGTTGYRVAGPEVDIQPQGFDADDVVNSGVSVGNARLSYDRGLGIYTFEPRDGNGTYRVFWTVERQVERTTNNTTEVVTEREQVEAVIRVTGQTEMEHQPAGTSQEIRQKAQNWEAFNSSISEIRQANLLLVPDSASNEDIIRGMRTTYIDTRDPFRALNGGFTTFHVIIVSSVGAAAAALFYAGFAIRAWWKERRKRQELESVEPDEGAMNEKLRELDEQERLRVFANWEHTDVAENDHYADGLRALGTTPQSAWEALSANLLTPATLIRDKLRAMGSAGYQAVVEERQDGAITAVSLVQTDDETATDGGDVVDLETDELPDDLLQAACNTDAFAQFDLRREDYTPTDVDTPPETHDLDQLHDLAAEQFEWFDDPDEGAGLIYELVDEVTNSPMTDPQGAPDGPRRVLNEWLHEVQIIRDEFNINLASLQAETLEAALKTHDPAAKADKYREDVEKGKV